jgi:hypothetical protein
VRVLPEFWRAGVAADLGVQQLLGVPLPAQGALVEGLDLGIGQDMLGGVAPAVVAPVHLMRRVGAGRDDHQQVALGGLTCSGDLLDPHVHGWVGDGPGDLVDALALPGQLDGGELAVVVDADDQHATVRAELGQVAGVFLVSALARVQLLLEVDGVPLAEQPLVQHVPQPVLGVGQPVEHGGRLLAACSVRWGAGGSAGSQGRLGPAALHRNEMTGGCVSGPSGVQVGMSRSSARWSPDGLRPAPPARALLGNVDQVQL